MEQAREGWRKFEQKMERNPIHVTAVLDGTHTVKAMIDSGCAPYGIISSRLVKKLKLQRIPFNGRKIEGFDGKEQLVKDLACVCLDIGGHVAHMAYMYVVRTNESIETNGIILGMPWMNAFKAAPHSEDRTLRFKSGIILHDESTRLEPVNIKPISAVSFAYQVKKSRQKEGTRIFAVSMKDIEKALHVKKSTDPRTKLPKQYMEFLDVFDRKTADTLSPFRGTGVDHGIELTKTDGKEDKPPWGPLYNMSRDELLVLRKTLLDYLDKGFIRVSNSPAAAPVLFARKPGGGLRFCVDYRGLNAITRKDRYPLPLINETLERIGKAKWFTKLDIIAAFHKIRIAEGDEWKTAFRTRYGLYEWLVTPFGLSNAPSTFQKYINWTLRELLDEFVSAYIDDILIFSSGSLDDHRQKVKKVLQRLREANLQVDIDKCDFEVQSTKYLGFIIEAGKGVRMDPAKVKAIMEWEAPTTVKGVRGFIGFANFYRRFIKAFSKIVEPLIELTKKDRKFDWNKTTNEAFEKLKRMFITAPMLLQFSPERETVVETDSSGYVTGGALSQYDDEGLLRPCAFFSKRNSPAECNYEIHDKELLAVIRALEEWDSQLRSVKGFKIITDHKNLEYFMTTRRLSERQVRWAQFLSRFNFELSYRPGRQNTVADALSRRDQDLPKDVKDERFTYRDFQLLKPVKINRVSVCQLPTTSDESSCQASVKSLDEYPSQLSAAAKPATTINEKTSIEKLWAMAKDQDNVLKELKDALRNKARTFPSRLGVKASITECELRDDELYFRNRKWVPDFEPLRTKILQKLHDSRFTGHPGREAMYRILARDYFWPDCGQWVRRFTRNCDVCRSNNASKERRQGLLKPLPVPDRIWRHISVDFIVELPDSQGYTNIMVVTDRLSKGVLIEPCKDITAETVAEFFLKTYLRQHHLPESIISDRGTQFVGALWSSICKSLGIQRSPSTAYHPETDGATERANQTLESYLRKFINYAQDDWANLLATAELTMNSRDSVTTGVSPFFLSHGYNVDPLQFDREPQAFEKPRNPVEQGQTILKKLKDATMWAQASMAAAQQEQEHQANRHRQPAPEYRVGDTVWLNMKNVKTERQSKKLDVRNAKFKVIEKVGSHTYRLDTPTGLHNGFHVDLLKLAATDPLPSQVRHEPQPPAIEVDGQEEFHVEKILEEKLRYNKPWYKVKWIGWTKPSWEPASNMEDTVALNDWLLQQKEKKDSKSKRRRGVM